jgi:tetratricopeptide (TPR) repeat protein
MKENRKAGLREFYKRWDFEYGHEKRVEDFKNRVLNRVDTFIRKVFVKHENSSLFLKYLKVIGVYIDEDKFNSTTRDWKIKILKSKIEGASLEEMIFYLQQLFCLDIAQDVKDRLYKDLREDIKLSMLDIRLKKTEYGQYLFYPSGANLLDMGVVNDVLDWLSDYQESYKSFESALKKYQEQKYERNLIDDLRLSLELLFKRILKSEKALEKQKESLRKFLEDRGVPKEIRNMFEVLVSYYVNYQNENVKHNDKVRKSEVEFMIYLTGTFARFLLSLGINEHDEP